MAIYQSSSSTSTSPWDWVASILNPSGRKSLVLRHGDDSSSLGLLGGATALGFSLFILRYLGHIVYEKVGYGPLEGYRRLVHSLFLRNQRNRVIDGPSMKKAPECIDYHGACHCESVIFKMKAHPNLDVTYGSGKIPYPQTKVSAESFTLIQGSEYLRIYHAYNENEVPPSTLAYSFCSECAVHIVNASDSNVHEVSVNVNCVHRIGAQDENDVIEEELDEVCSLPPPSPNGEPNRDRAPSLIDVDRSSPVSNITQPAALRKMSSINEVGDSWVLHDPSRRNLEVSTSVAPINLITKMPPSNSSSSATEWPTESDSNSVYSGSYISRSTFDMGSIDGSVMDAFADADTVSRQEMLGTMRKYLKKSTSRKSSSASSSVNNNNNGASHTNTNAATTSTSSYSGTIPPRPPVLPS